MDDISKIKLPSGTYKVKDAEARDAISGITPTTITNEQVHSLVETAFDVKTPEAQTKTVTPSAKKQSVTADVGKQLTNVEVEPIPYSEATNESGGTTVTIG